MNMFESHQATYRCNPTSAHWLDPSNDTALSRIPGTNIGLLCRIALTSPNSVSSTMSSNGKYKSGSRSNVQIEIVFLSHSLKSGHSVYIDLHLVSDCDVGEEY